uniref:Cullin N-terminal domain-containing protein n=1 Tax=Acrobeloides nanus TaxID=290746 RepID=A0A914C8J7_9BILA
MVWACMWNEDYLKSGVQNKIKSVVFCDRKKQDAKHFQNNFENLYTVLDANLYFVYNNCVQQNEDLFEALYKIMYAISHIEPINIEEQDLICTNLYNKIDQILMSFLKALNTLETIQDDLEFIQKYSKLWILFLKGTLFLERIFFAWIYSWRKKFGIGGERLRTQYKFWDIYEKSMQIWKTAFFETSENHRIVRCIGCLMENERAGDKKYNTTLITDEMIQTFKILNSRLDDQINSEGADTSRKIRILKPTPMDKYEFFKFINEMIYAPIPREKVIDEKVLKFCNKVFEDDKNSNSNEEKQTPML